MRPFTLLVLVLCACGGLRPQAYCQELVKVSCTRSFECNKGLAEALYGSQAGCEAAQMNIINCDNVTDGASCGGRGLNAWNSGAASQCIGDIKKQDCATSSTPSSCSDSSLCSK